MVFLLRQYDYVFFLRDRARLWLDSLPTNSITIWNDLKNVLFVRYFPPSKIAVQQNQIIRFTQQDGDESLFDAWKRYKYLLRACPHHGLE